MNKKDVEHIARLARIQLSPGELVKFEKDLSDALGFVGKLNEVNTDTVEPLSGGIDLTNCMRDDEVDRALSATGEDTAEVARVVRAAPGRKDGYVKVRSVFN